MERSERMGPMVVDATTEHGRRGGWAAVDLPLGVVHLRAGGTSVVTTFLGDAAPQVLHWGEDLGDVPPDVLASLDLADTAPAGHNAPAVPVRVPILPEARTGWMGRPGLAGWRDGGEDWSPRLHVDRVETDCRDISRHGSSVSAGPGGWRIRLIDAEAGLEVLLEIELAPSGLVRLRASLTNTAGSVYHLEELSPVLPLPPQAREILDFSGRWSRERTPLRLPLEFGCRLHEGRHGRTGFDAPPMMFAGEPSFGFRSGEVWGAHVGFSGNYRLWIEKRPDGHQVIGGGELLLPGEVSLAAGATYTSPWVYFGRGSGLDEAAHTVHEWLRGRAGHPSPRRPVTLNVWEAVYFDQDTEHLVRLAEAAAGIGIERFVLDDGWFQGRHDSTAGLGDWVPDRETWPGGLAPLADRVHELGMEFGLWFEPEMVNPDSDLARAHPEWMMSARRDLPVAWRHQQVLNLADEGAFDHVRRQMSAVIERYGVDYVKWDHNRDLIDAGDRRHGGRAGVHEQTLAAYRLMDLLGREHPGLEIEGCSSGGARVDLGMAEHAARFWPSDCLDPLERQSIVRWTSQLLPLEMIGAHIQSPVSRTTGRTSSLDFRAATAVWGCLGVEWDVTEIGEGERGLLAEWIAWFKRKRGLLFTGDLVRADSPDPSAWVQGVVAGDRRSALYEFTTRERSGDAPRGRFVLPGLEAEAVYRVRPVIVGPGPQGLVPPPWFGPSNQGVEATGRILASYGLRAPRLFTDQALLFEVTAVSGESPRSLPGA
ncbi:alpha-galactosidase [Schaalia naturae]|uniref:alpha-galactosidase n=1 Tax=Schaalia naturae TaxID=635203 RepID=A0ABW2SQV1_9ACTO